VNRSLRLAAGLALAAVAIYTVWVLAGRWQAAPGQPRGDAGQPAADPPAAIAAREPGAAEPAGVPEPGNQAVRIPDRLPDFTLGDRDGKPTAISAWRGKSLIINFWATWCAPCRREIPLLESIDAAWSARNVAVIGVAVDRRDEVLAFARQFHMTYPLLIGEQDALDAAAAVGVSSPVFPFTVFADRRGEIVAIFIGELHRPQADLILREVERLDDEQIALPVARRVIAEGLDALHLAGTG
jgi:peroxiredoxin